MRDGNDPGGRGDPPHVHHAHWHHHGPDDQHDHAHGDGFVGGHAHDHLHVEASLGEFLAWLFGEEGAAPETSDAVADAPAEGRSPAGDAPRGVGNTKI